MNNELRNVEVGDVFEGIVKITRKAKPGPTIYSVTDASASIDAVTMREGNFEVGDVVELKGRVSNKYNKNQLEITFIKKTNTNFDIILDNKSIPLRKELSIESVGFEKMKFGIFSVAKRIRKAILDNQPIIIRHHADTDGLICGLSIEQSAKLFMADLGINPDYNIYRNPCKAPFYEMTDAFKDVSLSKRIGSFGQKKTLIVVLDNGSTPEDVLALKSLKSLGFDLIVVDHHNPVVLNDGVSAVCPYLVNHVNPYLVGLNGNFTAGMIAYEIGRFISEKFDNDTYSAVSGLADRSDLVELETFVARSGKSVEELKKLSTALDYAMYQLKFDGGKGIYEDIFNNTEFVDIINDEVNKSTKLQLNGLMPYIKSSDVNGVYFSYVDLHNYTMKFSYPTAGKILGVAHDRLGEGKEIPVLTLGVIPGMLIIRATQPILPVQTIIDNLIEKLPYANVDGGGHECAGTIKFISAHTEEVIKIVEEMIANLPR